MISTNREMAQTLGISSSAVSNLRSKGFLLEENGTLFFKKGYIKGILRGSSAFEEQKLQYLQVKTKKLENETFFQIKKNEEELKAAKGYSRPDVEKLLLEGTVSYNKITQKLIEFFDTHQQKHLKNELKKFLNGLLAQNPEKEEKYFD